MVVKGILKKGEYHDSVTLMRVAKTLSEMSGVADSAVVMATRENKHLLGSVALMTAEFESATESDLIIVVKAENEEMATGFLNSAVKNLKTKKLGGTAAEKSGPKSLESALKILPSANLALISVAGRYAADEAMRALERGLHVMLFSDNVPLEKEVELKKYAAERGLLVMGPDAGTAIINGVPLAFANNVRRGEIGIVAASGTGLQETTTLISNAGAGISQAIGTGGRDVKKEVGGLMFLQSLRALLADPQTKVLLLVSKPPHETVLAKILEVVRGAKKPVVATFLGADPAFLAKNRIGAELISAVTLEEGALKAVALARAESTALVDEGISAARKKLDDVAKAEIKKLRPGQKYLRGLFTGGTFVSETQVLVAGRLENVVSNAPLAGVGRIKDATSSDGHMVIDFGEDEFTVGRPHPMIDFSLRNKRILKEAEDGSVAVILLDLVLGWGAHPDPLPELLPVLKKAKEVAQCAGRHLPVVLSVTGTEADPQCRSKVVEALKSAGMFVAESNAAASYLAIKIAEGVKG